MSSSRTPPSSTFPCSHRAGARLIACLLCWLGSGPASAGSVWLASTDGISNVPASSIQERKFERVVRQQYDFSCGSAALATLLTFHYEEPTTEQAAFDYMYEKGDKEKIARVGFSLLDMKTYLETNGYQADGFEASLDTLAQAGVPAIALINYRGYQHFVVVKGIDNGEVLVGDPALGLRYMARGDFEAMWPNRILFIIRNRPAVGQAHFNPAEEWQSLARAPLGMAIDRESLASLTVSLPVLGEVLGD